MTDAKHTAHGDRSFARSVLRNLAGAVLLVVLMAGVFWAIGSIGRDDGQPVAGSDGAADDAGEDPATHPPDDPEPDTGDGDVTDPGTGDPDAPEPEPAPEPEGGTEADGTDADVPDGQGDADPADDPGDAPQPGPDPIDPGSISVQVLDGYQADGGTAAAIVAAQLRDAGYQVVAENPALRYEVTTVLWTAGSEDAAAQVAAEIGAAEVREQPGNLSTQVMVHVVVGADRG